MTYVYFGCNNRDSLDNLLDWGVKDILVSWAYLKGVKGDPMEWKEMGARKVFMDSGAFTFGKVTREIESDYIDYIKQWKAHIDDYAIMDYIPNAVLDNKEAMPDFGERRKLKGRSTLKAMKGVHVRKRNTAAERENMEILDRFHKAGLEPIAVWHRGETIQLLNHYATHCKKVGFGATKASIEEVQTFQRLTKGNLTHGFGFTRLSRFDIVRRFHSVDSVSWSDAAKYSGYSPHGRFKGTGEFGGALWQITGFSKTEIHGRQAMASDIKDYPNGLDEGSGLRTQRNIIRQKVSVNAYLRRLRSHALIDY